MGWDPRVTWFVLKGRINTTDVWSGGRCGCNRHRSSCYEVQLVSCSANRRALTHGVYVVATTTYRTLVVQKGYKDVTTDAYGSIWLQSAPSRKKKTLLVTISSHQGGAEWFPWIQLASWCFSSPKKWRRRSTMIWADLPSRRWRDNDRGGLEMRREAVVFQMMKRHNGWFSSVRK